MMILDLHRQGLSVAAIARETGKDVKTIRRYIAHGLEPPVYGPRPSQACRLDSYKAYLQERIAAYPQLSGRRLLREIRALGYDGGYTAVTDFLRTVRPAPSPSFEVRFETPPGRQAQVDFAQFQVVFADQPAVTRIVWLFSLVLGSSRFLWARFVLHQDLQTVLRCHIAAFAELGGVPQEILYDRMKTAVIGEATEGGIVYNRTLLDFAGHYRFHPRACRPYRAKTKGKVERPFRTTASPTPPGGGWSRCTRSPTRSASSRTVRSSPLIRCSKGAAGDGSPPVTGSSASSPEIRPLPPMPR